MNNHYEMMERSKKVIGLQSFRACFILVIIISHPSFTYGQKQIDTETQLDAQTKAAIETQKWLSRVNRITSDLTKDLFPLSESEKSIFLVQIARLWWKEDNAAAKDALKKALSLVSVLDTDAESVRAEKLATARKLLNTVILFDKQSTDKLLEEIDKAEKNDQTSESNGKAILQAALSVVAIDPEQAFQLGIKSLRYGIFDSTITLVAQLSLRDGGLASKLTIQTANLAVQKNENSWINSLSALIFIALKGRNFSDEAQKTILDLVFKAGFGSQSAPDSCDSVVRGLYLIAFYDKLLPLLSGPIRQKGVLCRNALGTAKGDAIGEKLGEVAPKSVDELIELAQNSKNPDEKGEYYRKAIKLLTESEQYNAALSILDDIKEEDRKTLGDFGEETVWEGLRWDYAYRACLTLLKEDDEGGVRAIVNKTPDNIRTILQGRLAAKMINTKDNSYTFELLQAGRKNISKIRNRNLAAQTYLEIVRIYVLARSSEISVVFSEFMKIINEADSYASEHSLPKFNSTETIISLPAELLEIDELGTLNSLGFLSSPEGKARLRLGLLESSLKKYVSFRDKEKSDALKNNKQAPKPKF